MTRTSGSKAHAQCFKLCVNCDDDGEGIIAFCPLHKAAGELLEALKAIKRQTSPPANAYSIGEGRAHEIAEAAITKATGKEKT